MGCLKKGVKRENALDALESLKLKSRAPDPVVATMAPKYLPDASRWIRGPGALGGRGEHIGNRHCPFTIGAKCSNPTELTRSAIHLSNLRFHPTLRAWICKQRRSFSSISEEGAKIAVSSTYSTSHNGVISGKEIWDKTKYIFVILLNIK